MQNAERNNPYGRLQGSGCKVQRSSCGPCTIDSATVHLAPCTVTSATLHPAPCTTDSVTLYTALNNIIPLCTLYPPLIEAATLHLAPSTIDSPTLRTVRCTARLSHSAHCILHYGFRGNFFHILPICTSRSSLFHSVLSLPLCILQWRLSRCAPCTLRYRLYYLILCALRSVFCTTDYTILHDPSLCKDES